MANKLSTVDSSGFDSCARLKHNNTSNFKSAENKIVFKKLNSQTIANGMSFKQTGNFKILALRWTMQSQQ